jgi:hypothetical protein
VKLWVRAAAAVSVLAWVSPVAAQTQGTGGRTVYEAAFFKAFSPSNALQIVQRVPGFTLETGDTSVRGFSQAAGNVVINGQRPSSKADTLDVILSRIPASRVARVEVGPGDLFGSDYAGKAQVLNLVLTSEGGLAGSVTGILHRDFTGRLYPEGSVSALLRRGKSSFTVSVGVNNNQSVEEGYDTLKALPSLRLLEYRRKTNYTSDPNGFVSGSWEYNGGVNRTAHVNARAALDLFSLTQANTVIPTGGTIRNDHLTERYHRHEYELGGDITRPFLGGGLKLVGLATRRHRLNKDVSLNRVNSVVTDGFGQTLDDERDETLARLVWSKPKLFGWAVEIGAEGVVNRLRSDVDLFEFAPGGASTTTIPLPIGHAVVTEHRGEAFVNASRTLTPKLRVDLGLTYEASHLTVTGDAKAARTLQFLKPKAVFDWRPGGGWHASLSLQRTVAQLQFEDFISVAELTNNRVNGGNANLQPQRAWEALATLEHPILGDGVIKLEAGYNRVQLVQDRVPTPQGFDAPGNLGDGELRIARLRLDAPLKRFGIKGGRLSAYVSYVGTSVVDPYTHRSRPFSGSSDLVVDISFRQDLGKFAWGVEASANTPVTFYRLDELDRNSSAWPYVVPFVEWRPDRRTSLNLTIDNATGIPAFRNRTFFEPSRANPVPSFLERRWRTRHIIPMLTFKRSFG